MDKIVRADNPGQNMWNKVKKSGKIGQEQKTVIFALSLANFYIFLVFPNFLRF